jgi:hypothetical protein
MSGTYRWSLLAERVLEQVTHESLQLLGFVGKLEPVVLESHLLGTLSCASVLGAA